MTNILQEEEYLRHINDIIEADYFPDKKRMSLMNNLIEAKESGNLGILKATEKMLENVNSQCHLGLDVFLAKYNSEDNVSFDKLQQEHAKKIREKYWWVNSTPKGVLDKSNIEPFNALMFMPRTLANNYEFKRPNKQIIKNNTRLGKLEAVEKGYNMPEPSEKEIIARRLADQSIRSERSSRNSTPRTPNSSRISSIFPILNYQLPSKRPRNQ